MADTENEEYPTYDKGDAVEQSTTNELEHSYVNNITLMGNASKKPAPVETRLTTEEKSNETVTNESQPSLRNSEEAEPNQHFAPDVRSLASQFENKHGAETDQRVTPDVRSLASQFENKHGLIQKHETKKVDVALLQGVQSATKQAEPFLYALAKDIPKTKDCEINGCNKCSSLGTSCPSCAIKLGVGNSTGCCIDDQTDTFNVANTPSQLNFNEELQQKLETRHVENAQNDEKSATYSVAKLDFIPENDSVDSPDQFEHCLEQTIYDSVCNTPTSSASFNDFEVVEKDQNAISRPSEHGISGKHRDSRKLLKAGEDYDWKRKEAKKKSKTLKRSPKSENPFSQHAMFEDPHKGALPEAERDDGIMETMNPFSLMEDDSGSNISDYSDSSFDTDSDKSDSETFFRQSYSNKPLPKEPSKNKVNVVRDLRQLIYRGEPEDIDDKIALEKVNLRRRRESPALPEAQSSLTQNQVRLRGVLQSLIDSEKNYITSLERLVKEYREPILTQFGVKKAEVAITLNKVEEILQIHQMFQIELGDKLSKWATEEKIGNTFHLFSGNMVLDIYSEYVNNYEAASELIKEASMTKQGFSNFLKERQMSSTDRLSLPGLMLKPIQRFPQFIMIIKDLLKYTPRVHHDRVPLQEALTGMENVAHQLNERKRQSEQFFHGHQIAARLAPRIPSEKKVFLIRQDNVNQVSQDTTGQQNMKQRRLFLMNDKLISVFVIQKDLNGGVEKFTYKWHQNLSELELTTSAITPNMQTTVHNDNKTILSPKIDPNSEDPYSLATDLTDMVHDISILAQIQMMVSALRLSYSKLNEDLLHEMMTSLQQDIQGADYQLQLLNSSSIILQDKARKKKYVFSAANASIKQEWCIDFLLAKYALDIVNIPSWHKQEIQGIHDKSQPALLMKHLSIDMQRTFTRVKCAVPVYFPMRNEGFVEHLWVCSANESLSQVSIVSLHTARPALVESFQATQSEIICVEMVPGFAVDTTAKTAFAHDTVWMSTTESEILVFMLSERDSTGHRKPVHVFKQSSVIVSMLYLDDRVFCGNRNGCIVIYNRNDFGDWALTQILTLGKDPVKSIIYVNDTIWAGCGPTVHIIDSESSKILDTVSHQQQEEVHFNCLVKAGVGVWASFQGRSNISLYHVETKHHLQDFNIGTAVNDFVSVHSGSKESTKNYKVTSLMASLGLLWVGTDIGVVLTYPLPRLRDGVPKINQRPSVALHGHNGPVQFIIPVHYGPVSGAPIKRRPSEILKKNKINQSVIQRLPKLNEHSRPLSADSHKYLSLDAETMARQREMENVYEPVDTSCLFPSSNRESGIYEDMSKLYEDVRDLSLKDRPEVGVNQENAWPKMEPDKIENDDEKQGQKGTSRHVAGSNDNADAHIKPLEGDGEKEQRSSGEHTYFVLEKQETCAVVSPTSSEYTDMTGSVKLKDKYVVLDDNNATTRAKTTPPLQNSSQLSFHSELKNKVKRKSVENIVDLDVNTKEVGRLYQTLMRPGTTVMGHQDVSSPQDSFNYRPEDTSEATYIRNNFANSIITRKPNDYAGINKKGLRLDSVKQKRQASVTSEQKSPQARTNRNKVASSFSMGSNLDTLRRQDSNTILVLTGGDGYKDWKKRQSLQGYRPDEPSLVFWLYKF